MCYEVPIVQSRNDILSWNFSVIIRECYPHFSLSFSDNNEYIEFNYEELLSNNNYAKKTKPYNIEICAGWQDNTLFSFLSIIFRNFVLERAVFTILPLDTIHHSRFFHLTFTYDFLMFLTLREQLFSSSCTLP